MNDLVLSGNSIKGKIHLIRGLYVMLDSDLAELYNVNTKVLNQAVKRNLERFPNNFMFQLTESEYNSLRSQIATLEKENFDTEFTSKQEQILRSQIATSSGEALKPPFTAIKEKILKSQIVTSSWGGKRKPAYAFTEQGVAMLSGVLKSNKAVQISIQIMEAFVSMRKFISKNSNIFNRLDNIEQKQLSYDKKFEEIFEAIESKDIKPDKGIFFDGQIFDAYKFVSNLIRTANSSIVLIDNYIDDSVLTLFNKRNKDVTVKIFTKEISKELLLDLAKYNSQYSHIEVNEFKQSHDRFLIIDDKEVYHLGASLKDLGKKWFAFCKFDKEAFKILEKLK